MYPRPKPSRPFGMPRTPFNPITGKYMAFGSEEATEVVTSSSDNSNDDDNEELPSGSSSSPILAWSGSEWVAATISLVLTGDTLQLNINGKSVSSIEVVPLEQVIS